MPLRFSPLAAAALLIVAGSSLVSAGESTSPAAKLDACRKAALANAGSTDFRCDWKAVIRTSPGAAFTGRYRIAERGLDGEMTILEGGATEGPAIGAAGPSGEGVAYSDKEIPGGGEVAVRPEPPPQVLVAIVTATRDRAAYTCNLDLRGTRTGDELVLKEVTEEACVVRLSATRQLNTLRVVGTDACRNFCGMNGGYEGAWTLRR